MSPVTIGARAAMLYRATPRGTVDIDFLILRDAPEIADAFEAEGMDVRAITDEDGDTYLYLVKGPGDALLDILVADTEYQAEAYRRAINGYLTVEDVIIHKLIAWRPRDQDDIRSVLAAGHDFDQRYINRWADAWSVSTRWSEARRNA